MKPSSPAPSAQGVMQRIAALDWNAIALSLDEEGCATVRNLITSKECDAIAALYSHDALFRNRVIMARHGFGRGEYKYFAYPLPDIVSSLRTAMYRQLAQVANRWNTTMRGNVGYPLEHADFLQRCHNAGQRRATPLMLSYGTGDYNCLHQDLYGEQVFPLQSTVLLSDPSTDFTGGEFVMTEQRPRMQSCVRVVLLGKGDAVIFAVNNRPVQGARGPYRVNLRHGVSPVRSGHRRTLGIIFHDAL